MSELSKKELAKKILALANEIERLKKERGDCPLYVVIRNQEMRQMVEQYVKANT